MRICYIFAHLELKLKLAGDLSMNDLLTEICRLLDAIDMKTKMMIKKVFILNKVALTVDYFTVAS